MTATLFGEITPDHKRIILVGEGDSYDLNVIASGINHLTMAHQETEPAALKAVSVPASWATVTQLAHSFAGDGTYRPRWVPGARLCEWAITELTRRTSLPDMAAYPSYPPWLKARDYQDAGAAAIAQMGRFLLFDEPGLGKTVTTLLGLEWRANLGHEIFPVVIVVPSWAVARGWAKEIAAWLPGWKQPVMYAGPDRTELLGSAEVYLTTFATLRRDAADIKGPLCKLITASPDDEATVVIDEAHFLKSQEAKQSKAGLRLALHAGTVAELTGTPVTIDTSDAWAIMAAAAPADFPSRARFVARWCEKTDNGYGEKIEGLKLLAADEFFAATTGFMRRVNKRDVLTQLPPKIYTVREVKIPPEWREAYDGMRDDMLAELPDGGELEVMDTLAKVQRLSQLASSACHVDRTEEVDPETGLVKVHYEVTPEMPSWKVDELLEILAERRGQPVLVFAPHKKLIMIAGQQAKKAGRRVGYLTGLGGGVTEKSRQADIAAFTAGLLDVLVATTEAGGTGIDGLQVAGTVVFLQRPRRLDSSIQAEDRAHRIGSEIHERGVEIIDIVAADTVDETIRAALLEHGGQLGQFLRDPAFVRELMGGLA